MRGAYRGSTLVLSALLCVVGIAMVVSTIARGGGPLAIGVVVGAMFAVLGAGRFVIALRLQNPHGRT